MYSVIGMDTIRLYCPQAKIIISYEASPPGFFRASNHLRLWNPEWPLYTIPIRRNAANLLENAQGDYVGPASYGLDRLEWSSGPTRFFFVEAVRHLDNIPVEIIFSLDINGDGTAHIMNKV